MRVGIIGLGRMGAAIAERLRQQNVEVMAFDVDDNKRKSVHANNVQIAKNSTAVAESSDVVISIVSDDDAVRSIFSEMRRVGIAKKLFIQMSTVQPATVRDMAGLVDAAGAALIDSPVLGSIPTVLEGKLVALVGGRPEDVERASPILRLLTRKIVHLGLTGTGSAAKLAANLTMAAYLQALAESLALAQRHGVNLESMLDVLLDTPTANNWLKNKLSVLKGGGSAVTLDIQTLRKDIMDAVAAAATKGVPMPLGTSVLTSLSAALVDGWGPRDLAELPRFFREFMLHGETH
jgi:3-hydroxyisobutyrate dehydrogenase